MRILLFSVGGSRSSNLAPCLHGGRSGCRYPHEPQQQETKYFIDYD